MLSWVVNRARHSAQQQPSSPSFPSAPLAFHLTPFPPMPCAHFAQTAHPARMRVLSDRRESKDLICHPLAAAPCPLTHFLSIASAHFAQTGHPNSPATPFPSVASAHLQKQRGMPLVFPTKIPPMSYCFQPPPSSSERPELTLFPPNPTPACPPTCSPDFPRKPRLVCRGRRIHATVADSYPGWAYQVATAAPAERNP